MSSEPKQQIEDGILAQTLMQKTKKQNLLQKNIRKHRSVPFYPLLQIEKAWHLLGFFIFCS